MSKFTIGSLVKLSPELFKENYKPEGHFGKLGYAGVFRDIVWKVTSEPRKVHHGMGVELEATNCKYAKGTILLLVDDLIKANEKVTIEYKIVDKNYLLNQQLLLDFDKLKSDRVELKLRGMKIANPIMKNNWEAQKTIREKIANIKTSGEIDVLIPKIGQVFKVKTILLENKKELDITLSDLVRKFRSELLISKAKPKELTYMGKKFNVTNNVFEKPYTLGKLHEDGLIEVISKPKVPTSNLKHLGVEIELLHKCTREELNKLFIKERLHKHVHIGTDGSISTCSDGYHASEIRVLLNESEVDEVFTKINKVFAMRTVDAYTNRSCGLHIHLDMRDRDHKKCYENLYKIQSILRLSQPTSRLVNQYCTKNTNPTFVECERNDTGRRCVINTNAYKKQKSLEIRVHEGTTNTTDITNWIKFLVGVVSFEGKLSGEIKNTTDLLKEIPSIDMSGINYVNSRMNKFGLDEVV